MRFEVPGLVGVVGHEDKGPIERAASLMFQNLVDGYRHLGDTRSRDPPNSDVGVAIVAVHCRVAGIRGGPQELRAHEEWRHVVFDSGTETVLEVVAAVSEEEDLAQPRLPSLVVHVPEKRVDRLRVRLAVAEAFEEVLGRDRDGFHPLRSPMGDERFGGVDESPRPDDEPLGTPA